MSTTSKRPDPLDIRSISNISNASTRLRSPHGGMVTSPEGTNRLYSTQSSFSPMEGIFWNQLGSPLLSPRLGSPLSTRGHPLLSTRRFPLGSPGGSLSPKIDNSGVRSYGSFETGGPEDAFAFEASNTLINTGLSNVLLDPTGSLGTSTNLRNTTKGGLHTAPNVGLVTNAALTGGLATTTRLSTTPNPPPNLDNEQQKAYMDFLRTQIKSAQFLGDDRAVGDLQGREAHYKKADNTEINQVSTQGMAAFNENFVNGLGDAAKTAFNNATNTTQLVDAIKDNFTSHPPNVAITPADRTNQEKLIEIYIEYLTIVYPLSKIRPQFTDYFRLRDIMYLNGWREHLEKIVGMMKRDKDYNAGILAVPNISTAAFGPPAYQVDFATAPHSLDLLTDIDLIIRRYTMYLQLDLIPDEELNKEEYFGILALGNRDMFDAMNTINIDDFPIHVINGLQNLLVMPIRAVDIGEYGKEDVDVNPSAANGISNHRFRSYTDPYPTNQKEIEKIQYTGGLVNDDNRINFTASKELSGNFNPILKRNLMRPLDEFFIGTAQAAALNAAPPGGGGAVTTYTDARDAVEDAFKRIKTCINSLTAKYLKTEFGYSKYDEMSTYFKNKYLNPDKALEDFNKNLLNSYILNPVDKYILPPVEPVDSTISSDTFINYLTYHYEKIGPRVITQLFKMIYDTDYIKPLDSLEEAVKAELVQFTGHEAFPNTSIKQMNEATKNMVRNIEFVNQRLIIIQNQKQVLALNTLIQKLEYIGEKLKKKQARDAVSNIIENLKINQGQRRLALADLDKYVEDTEEKLAKIESILQEDKKAQKAQTAQKAQKAQKHKKLQVNDRVIVYSQTERPGIMTYREGIIKRKEGDKYYVSYGDDNTMVNIPREYLQKIQQDKKGPKKKQISSSQAPSIPYRRTSTTLSSTTRTSSSGGSGYPSGSAQGKFSNCAQGDKPTWRATKIES